MIETIVGPKDETTLVCETVAFDGPQYYAYERRYREPGKEQVIARYHDVKWMKENEFEPSPEVVSTIRGDMPLEKLEKRTGTHDDEREFNCWVEYRALGEEEIIHRSAHVKLKVPPDPVFASAGRVS